MNLPRSFNDLYDLKLSRTDLIKDEMESKWIFKKSRLLFLIKILLNYSAVRDGMEFIIKLFT